MGKGILYILVGIVVSAYYFSFSFTFLPEGINTKMILAVVGIVIAALNIIKARTINIDRGVLGAMIMAIIFSLVCFYSVDYNRTSDYSYASYFVSFAVWMFSAYTVCSFIFCVHGTVNFKILCFYLAGVCFVQCVLALGIDNISGVQESVDRFVEQGQDFLKDVDRIYGIGASLDNAGVRFSIVLILISVIITIDDSVKNNRLVLFLLLTAFFVIGVVGNMISRTTLIGLCIALVIFLWSSKGVLLNIYRIHTKILASFFIVLVIGGGITAYLYYTNETYYEYIRFAFEGFFNLLETGEWRTDSTDKLNNHMWVWPEDSKSWIIGTGLFDDWIYGTDIGYCRFVLYCGIVGLTTFSLFFIYLVKIFIEKYPRYTILFGGLLLLTFIVWIKVSTDIFLIYGLFFGMDIFKVKTRFSDNNNEDHLLHSGNI